MLRQALAETFPNSDWLISQAALAQYNLRNFDEAQELFEDLLARDPYRIEVRPSVGTSHTSTLRGELCCQLA